MVKKFEFTVKTQGNIHILDITEYLVEALDKSDCDNGIITAFVPGSTAALTTIEFESGAVEDLVNAIKRMAPKDIEYAHNAAWGDGNGHSHVRAALIGPSLTVPFDNKKLIMGTWQQAILIDFDNRERNRRLICQVVGE